MSIAAPMLDLPKSRDATKSARRWWLVIAGITALATVLRIFAINSQSFWYDEAVAADLVRHSFLDLARGIAKDNGNPPLYWLMLRPWYLLFGDSEAALRSLSVIFGCLTIPAIAALGRKLAGASAGTIAALLFAISPLSIELSNEARAYALLHLLSVVSTLLLVNWLHRQRLWMLLAYAVTTFAVCWTHYFGFFVPLAHGIAILAGKDSRPLFIKWFGAMLLAGALWLPWLPEFRAQLHQPGNLSRMGDRWMLQFLATPSGLAFGRTLVWRDSSRIAQIASSVAALLFFWLPAFWGLSCARRRVGALLGGWLLLPIAIPLLIALAATPLYHVRAASVALPALVLAAAIGISYLPAGSRLAMLCCVVLLTAISIHDYATKPLKDDWRDASAEILPALRANEPVVFDTSIEVDSFRYYARRAGVIPARMIGITQPATLEGVTYFNGNRVTVIASGRASDIFSGSSFWLAMCVPNGSIDQYRPMFAKKNFVPDREAHFNRIDLYHFHKIAPQ